jgi:hypothetical protein
MEWTDDVEVWDDESHHLIIMAAEQMNAFQVLLQGKVAFLSWIESKKCVRV